LLAILSTDAPEPEARNNVDDAQTDGESNQGQIASRYGEQANQAKRASSQEKKTCGDKVLSQSLRRNDLQRSTKLLRPSGTRR
jgi:hypothetical protein